MERGRRGSAGARGVEAGGALDGAQREGAADGSPGVKHYPRDFLGGSGVGTLDSQSGDIGSIPGQGIKIPDVAWCGQEDKKEPLFWKRQRSRKRWIMSVG